MSIKAVIFDLDGTITQPFFDFDAIREEIGLDRNAGPILEVMAQMSDRQRQRAEQILHSHEQRAVEESVLNNGTRQTLKTLGNKGIDVGILTRNTRSNALAVLEKHNLKFDAIVSREDGPVKPDAFGVLSLCERFNVEPAETLVVGDYLFDLLCAKAAGAIAVLLKNHARAEQFVPYADFAINTLDELPAIIKDIENQ